MYHSRRSRNAKPRPPCYGHICRVNIFILLRAPARPCSLPPPRRTLETRVHAHARSRAVALQRPAATLIETSTSLTSSSHATPCHAQHSPRIAAEMSSVRCSCSGLPLQPSARSATHAPGPHPAPAAWFPWPQAPTCASTQHLTPSAARTRISLAYPHARHWFLAAAAAATGRKQPPELCVLCVSMEVQNQAFDLVQKKPCYVLSRTHL